MSTPVIEPISAEFKRRRIVPQPCRTPARHATLSVGGAKSGDLTSTSASAPRLTRTVSPVLEGEGAVGLTFFAREVGKGRAGAVPSRGEILPLEEDRNSEPCRP